MLMEIYEGLLAAYGPQGWWPVTPEGECEPGYSGGPRNALQRFEVAFGAILTQNTAWSNASRAIENLNRNSLMSPERIRAVALQKLAETIRSAGYFNQKAERLKLLVSNLPANRPPTRETLLAVKGIGPETADSILLYGYDRLHFVVDAYTRRIFSRVGLVTGDEPYEEISAVFEGGLPRSVEVYQEYHALIVEHGKRRCLRSRPLCRSCCISRFCRCERDADMSKFGSPPER
jgi:endonuclease-3 related protein